MSQSSRQVPWNAGVCVEKETLVDMTASLLIRSEFLACTRMPDVLTPRSDDDAHRRSLYSRDCLNAIT